MASRSVGNARGWDGWRSRRAFKIVSLGPVIASTRVSRGPGEIPIDRLLMSRLLARGRGLLDGDPGRALGDRRRAGNFSATGVRHYLTASGAKVAHPARGCPTPDEALPVALLGRATGDGALKISALGRAVDLAPVTRRAEVHDAAARIPNTLNLPKIVHPRRARPPGIGPPRTSRATTTSSYASTRGDRGLGGSKLRALSLDGDRDDRPEPASRGPTTPPARPAPNQADPGARLHS